MACVTYCELYCQSYCESVCEQLCESYCEITCQWWCESACEWGCQYVCELDCQGCQSDCELYCQSICETYCQGCEDLCQDCEYGCLDTCESFCEHYCQTGCQDTCEVSCETGCEVTCQNCQTGCQVSCQTCQVYSETAPPIPSAPPTLVERLEDAALELTWGTSTGATAYQLGYWVDPDGALQTRTYSPATTYILDGLIHGTTYNLKVCAAKGLVYSDYTYSNPCTTLPQTPTITKGTQTSTSVVINIGALTGLCDYVEVYKYDVDGNLLGQLTSNPSGTTYPGGSVTFTGLTPGTNYYFKAKSVRYVNATYLYSYNYSGVVTLIGPAPFAWDYPKVDGDDFYLHHIEWNRFLDTINEARSEKGLPALSLPHVNSGDDVTADGFNLARNGLNTLAAYITDGTVPPVVEKDDDIHAHYYRDLATCINSIV